MHIIKCLRSVRLFLNLFKDFKGRGLLQLYWDFCIPQLGSRIDTRRNQGCFRENEF